MLKWVLLSAVQPDLRRLHRSRLGKGELPVRQLLAIGLRGDLRVKGNAETGIFAGRTDDRDSNYRRAHGASHANP